MGNVIAKIHVMVKEMVKEMVIVRKLQYLRFRVVVLLLLEQEIYLKLRMRIISLIRFSKKIINY